MKKYPHTLMTGKPRRVFCFKACSRFSQEADTVIRLISRRGKHRRKRIFMTLTSFLSETSKQLYLYFMQTGKNEGVNQNLEKGVAGITG